MRESEVSPRSVSWHAANRTPLFFLTFFFLLLIVDHCFASILRVLCGSSKTRGDGEEGKQLALQGGRSKKTGKIALFLNPLLRSSHCWEEFSLVEYRAERGEQFLNDVRSFCLGSESNAIICLFIAHALSFLWLAEESRSLRMRMELITTVCLV